MGKIRLIHKVAINSGGIDLFKLVIVIAIALIGAFRSLLADFGM
jgi:hypothetical protein